MILRSLLTPYLITRFDSLSLSKQNYRNLLLNYWISLSLTVPRMTLDSRDQILCLKCLKRHCLLTKNKLSTVLYKISKLSLNTQSCFVMNPPKLKKRSRGNQSLKFTDLKFPGRRDFQFNRPKWSKNRTESVSTVETKVKQGVNQLKVKLLEINSLESQLKQLEKEEDGQSIASFKTERPIFNLECHEEKLLDPNEGLSSMPQNRERISHSYQNLCVMDEPRAEANNSIASLALNGYVSGKRSAQTSNIPGLPPNGQAAFENSFMGSYFHPPSRISNLEHQDLSEVKKAARILEKERHHLLKIMEKLNLIPCGACLDQLDLAQLSLIKGYEGKLGKEFKKAKRLSRKHFGNLQKKFGRYSAANASSIYANVGLCLEIQKKNLFRNLLKLEDKLVAESMSEMKGFTEYGKVLVEFKGSHLVFPFSLEDLLRLDKFRHKSLFKVHWSKEFAKPYSFSGSLNKMNAWKSIPKDFSVPEFPDQMLLFQNFLSKPYLKKCKKKKHFQEHHEDFEFSRFCLNLRNYSRIVEKRDTLHNIKQTRKSKVKVYKGVSTQSLALPVMTQVNEAIFTCHHCSYRGPREHFLECYQKNFFSRLVPGEELLKVFLNIKSNIHMFCEKVFCRECIKSFYPDSDSKENDFKNWICPFCREKCYCTQCNHRDLYFKMHDLFLSLGGDFELLKKKSPIQKLVNFFLKNSFYDIKYSLEGFRVVSKGDLRGNASFQLEDILRNQGAKFDYHALSKQRTNSFRKSPLLKKKPRSKIVMTKKLRLNLFKSCSHSFINLHSKSRKSELKGLFGRVSRDLFSHFGQMAILTSNKKVGETDFSSRNMDLNLPINSLENELLYADPFGESVRFRRSILEGYESEYRANVEGCKVLRFKKPRGGTVRQKSRLLLKTKKKIFDIYELVRLVKQREQLKLEAFLESMKNS